VVASRKSRCSRTSFSSGKSNKQTNKQTNTQMRPGDVMLVVGTSGVVYPAASLVDAALEKKGVHVIEVNPEASAITHR